MKPYYNLPWETRWKPTNLGFGLVPDMGTKPLCK